MKDAVQRVTRTIGPKFLAALVAVMLGEALVLCGLVFVFATSSCDAQLAIASVVAFAVPLLVPFLTLIVVSGFETMADDDAPEPPTTGNAAARATLFTLIEEK